MFDRIVLIVSLFFALSTVLAASAAPKWDAPQSAIAQPEAPAPQPCSRCHDHSSINLSGKALEKCQQCHESKLSDLGKEHEQAMKGAEQAAAKDKNLGLEMPMYSKQSRLGDKPNDMVLVPAGEFIMGTNSRLPDEGPEHKVTLKAFYIDKYEVTNLQYRKFNNETHRRSPSHFRNRAFPAGKADHPVTYVSWEDADAYCRWAGKRLPTDQEWEKAARGPDGRMFPWGDEFDITRANTPVRWKQLSMFGDTTPVGAFSKGASPYGIMDMSGNVWEWTASWYKAYPNNKVASESYGERYKTLKGGSWFDCSFYNCGISAPVFNRAFFAKKVKNDSFGFRCAKDVKQ